MDRTTAIVVTLVVYKVALLSLGVFGQRRTKSEADFYLGGRKLGPWVAAISAAASSSSVWTILGVSGAAYKWGIGALWIFPACVGGFVINWYILAPGLRVVTDRTGALTVTEILAGKRGTPWHAAIKGVASFIILVSLGCYVCAQFQGAGKTFSETFSELSFDNSVLIGGGVVILYTLLGGFWAVSLTDTLQGMLMAATAIMLPIGAMVAVGGVDGLMERLGEVEAEGYLSPVRGAAPSAALGFILGLLGIGLGYPGQPHVVNRIMALAGDDRALRAARRIAVGWAIVVYAGMIILGLCGRALYGDLADSESVFIRATNDLFPPVLSGIMLAAVLSAIMSTADSQLLVAGSTVTHDLGLGGPDQRSALVRSRLVVLLLSGAALVAALATDPKIFNKVLFAWGAMGAAFGPPLLFAALKRRLPDPGRTLLAMVVGCGTSVAAYYIFPAEEEKAFERVVPFLLATAIIATSARRGTSDTDSPAAA